MLTREQILGAALPQVEVPTPEWGAGGSVYVRALTGAERDALERMLATNAMSRASLAALCIVDASGARLFTDEDVEALAGTHGAALERVVSKALEFNRLTDASLTEAGN